jgi:PadR family transcriptional regulator PadR
VEAAVGVRAAVLLLLAEAPEHGYDLLPKIRERTGTNYNGAGMYRAMRKLEDEGLVESSWEDSPGRGPQRRYYNITDAGLVELDAHANHLKTSARLIRAFLRRYAALPAAEPP